MDREKITEILESFGIRMKEICDEQPYLMMLVAKSCEARNEALDQIEALIEQAKREERERIADWLLTQGAVWVDKNYEIIEAVKQNRMVHIDLSDIDLHVKGRGI